MKLRTVLLGLLLALPAPLIAQPGYTITGGLSNFDCGNHCDDPCDEFEGFYPVHVSNICREVVSNSALVFITGHNNPPARPVPCPADFNHSGILNSQDLFDFLTAFFSADNDADFNHDKAVNSQDFFDFVGAFFTGC